MDLLQAHMRLQCAVLCAREVCTELGLTIASQEVCEAGQVVVERAARWPRRHERLHRVLVAVGTGGHAPERQGFSLSLPP